MTEAPPPPICGIVMPISTLDGCDETHWSDVREILEEALEDAGFAPNLVSNADDVGIIQKRIIQNLYENPVVVTDVSGKNPNVMFELGIRLAFDKPTVIVKDDKTSYSFDTSPIEHLEYPRDLRFGKIIEFKEKLGEKLRSTYDKASNDPHYTTFLKHFGEFTVPKLDKKEIPSQEFILEELRALRAAVEKAERTPEARSTVPFARPGRINICLNGMPDGNIEETVAFAKQYPGVKKVDLINRGPDHKHIVVQLEPAAEETSSLLRALLNDRGRPFRVAKQRARKAAARP